MVTRISGKIEFEPENLTKKHTTQSWKRVAMVILPCDLYAYYAWFIKKRFSLELNKPLRNTHVTFISDRLQEKVFCDGKEIFDGKEVTLFLENEPRSNGEHWWLRVHSPDLEDVRESMGLSREPYFAFHMTLGYAATEARRAHSEYILRQCQRFELISNEPRKPLSTHEVWEQL
jgi:hypothetical protein